MIVDVVAVAVSTPDANTGVDNVVVIILSSPIVRCPYQFLSALLVL